MSAYSGSTKAETQQQTSFGRGAVKNVRNPKVRNPKVRNPKVRNPKVRNPNVGNHRAKNWTQYYYFRIYNYNASVVVG
jgi:hypothetical protein